MEQTQTPQTWRELLSIYVDDPHMRQSIVDALGINPVTLTRWIKQESIPRPHNLRRLLTILTPQDRQLFLSLVEKEGEGFSPLLQDEMMPGEPPVIPPEVYKRVLHTCSTIPKRLRFSSLCDLILPQALKQLDPHRLGMSIIVACCMPPSYDDKVRTLREIVGKGTAPWGDHLEQEAVLLGVESLAGYAVASTHLIANQNLEEEQGLSFGYRSTWETLLAAFWFRARSRTTLRRCAARSSRATPSWSPWPLTLWRRTFTNLSASNSVPCPLLRSNDRLLRDFGSGS